MYQWLRPAVVLSVVALALRLLTGCGDGRLGDECLARRDAAVPRLERAIERYAAQSYVACDIVEGSGTWACDGEPAVTVTADFRMVTRDGARLRTGVLAVYDNFEVFEVEDAED